MRARNIKPGFWENDELGELPYEGRLLFIGLWCMADREGRLEDRPRKIKGSLFRYDGEVAVDSLLNDLQSMGFILRYEVDGQRFIEVVNFKKHQSPHHTERKTTIPAPAILKQDEQVHESIPDSPVSDNDNRELTVNSPLIDGGNPSDSLNPDSLNPDSLNPDSLNPDSPKEDLKLKSCPELCRASEPEGSETPFVRIPLNKNGNEYSVSESQVREFEALYPAVDVRQELREIRAWNLSNPQKRKTAAGVLKHINGWLGKEQDKGGNGRNSRASPPDIDRRVSRITEHNMAVGKRWLEKGQT